MKRAPVLIASLGLLTGCHGFFASSAADSAGNAAAAATVASNVANLVAAYNSHDADRATIFDTADFVGMAHGQKDVIGPAQDLATDKLQMTDPAVRLNIADGRVDVAKAGDTAVWRGTYSFSYTDPKTKAATTEHGHWLTGWKLQGDGTWKTNWSVITDLPAA